MLPGIKNYFRFASTVVGLIIAILFALTWITCSEVCAAPTKRPPTKSKFYDFSEQLIDGEIRRPTTLYTDSRKKVRFERLLRLKKSFMRELYDTAKEKVFK